MKDCMWKFNLGRLQIDGLILSGFITTSVKADQASMLIITPEPPHRQPSTLVYEYELFRSSSYVRKI